jgi:hypothetical protein
MKLYLFSVFPPTYLDFSCLSVGKPLLENLQGSSLFMLNSTFPSSLVEGLNRSGDCFIYWAPRHGLWINEVTALFCVSTPHLFGLWKSRVLLLENLQSSSLFMLNSTFLSSLFWEPQQKCRLFHLPNAAPWPFIVVSAFDDVENMAKFRSSTLGVGQRWYLDSPKKCLCLRAKYIY